MKDIKGERWFLTRTQRYELCVVWRFQILFLPLELLPSVLLVLWFGRDPNAVFTLQPTEKKSAAATVG